MIKVRKINSNNINEFVVSGENIQEVNILPGYTHSIENVGNTEMILFIWTNEIFDTEKPDTIYMEV